jgi:hypothetical protein
LVDFKTKPTNSKAKPTNSKTPPTNAAPATTRANSVFYGPAMERGERAEIMGYPPKDCRSVSTVRPAAPQ